MQYKLSVLMLLSALCASVICMNIPTRFKKDIVGTKKAFIDTLPNELLFAIFKDERFKVADLNNIMRTEKRYNGMMKSDKGMQQFYLEHVQAYFKEKTTVMSDEFKFEVATKEVILNMLQNVKGHLELFRFTDFARLEALDAIYAERGITYGIDGVLNWETDYRNFEAMRNFVPLYPSSIDYLHMLPRLLHSVTVWVAPSVVIDCSIFSKDLMHLTVQGDVSGPVENWTQLKKLKSLTFGQNFFHAEAIPFRAENWPPNLDTLTFLRKEGVAKSNVRAIALPETLKFVTLQHFDPAFFTSLQAPERWALEELSIFDATGEIWIDHLVKDGLKVLDLSGSELHKSHSIEIPSTLQTLILGHKNAGLDRSDFPNMPDNCVIETPGPSYSDVVSQWGTKDDDSPYDYSAESSSADDDSGNDTERE